jgi:hypothetical protein
MAWISTGRVVEQSAVSAGGPEQITPAQFLAARKLIGRTVIRVCRDLQITKQTLQKADGVRKVNISPYVASKLRTYYEAAGVIFTNGDDPGVRLRQDGQALRHANHSAAP